MKFEVLLHRGARKFLDRMRRPERERVERALMVLEADPFTSRPGADIERLKGTRGRQDLFRLRVGKWRVVSAVEGANVVVAEVWEQGQGYDV